MWKTEKKSFEYADMSTKTIIPLEAIALGIVAVDPFDIIVGTIYIKLILIVE